MVDIVPNTEHINTHGYMILFHNGRSLNQARLALPISNVAIFITGLTTIHRIGGTARFCWLVRNPHFILWNNGFGLMKVFRFNLQFLLCPMFVIKNLLELASHCFTATQKLVWPGQDIPFTVDENFVDKNPYSTVCSLHVHVGVFFFFTIRVPINIGWLVKCLLCVHTKKHK